MLNQLTTPRLILNPITPDIINELFKTKTKEQIIEHFGFDEDGYLHLEEMNTKGMVTHRLSLFVFLLIDKETNKPLGECGFHTWNLRHRRAEVFYMLRKDEYKQKGIMSEALKVVLEFGFTQMGLHRVEGLVADWNTPSVKLLLKNNFVKEGTMREDYFVDGKNESSDCYSLLKWEWEKHNT